MTASVSGIYGLRPITEKQRARLFAIAYGTREEPGALQGTKREKVMQLFELIQRRGYDDWDAVDVYAPRNRWLRERDYDGLVTELLAMRGDL